MEIVNKQLILVLLFFLISGILKAQDQFLTLDKALIEISSRNDHALIFDPKMIPDIQVRMPSQKGNLKKNLNSILKGTSIEFIIKNQQIQLFQRRQIFGFIEDENSGERLISAMIFLPEENRFYVANDEGYFSFTSIADSLKVEISYVGYKSFKQILVLSEITEALSIKMHADLNLENILITDRVNDDLERSYIEQDKGSEISIFKNQAISAVGGEPDIHQFLIRQAGVTTGADGIGGIHMRGGKQDQNLVLYDGVKLYNSSHALGIFSVFNSSILDQARIHKMGSAGRFSGRLSSVMDVRIKNPDLQKAHAHVQISSLASQFNIEGPIVKDKLSLLFSVRRTHFDPLISYFGRQYYDDIDQAAFTNYYFYDINLKSRWKINNEQNVFFTFYRGYDNYDLNLLEFEDEFDLNDNTRINWRNTMASLRWNSIISKKTFANLTLSAYNYSFNSSSEEGIFDEDDNYQFNDDLFNAFIDNYQIRADFESIFTKHHLKYGIGVEAKIHNPGDYYISELDYYTDTIDQYVFDFPDYYNLEANMYISDKVRWRKRLILEATLYFTSHITDDPFNVNLQDFHRIHGYGKLQYKLFDDWFIGTSLGRFLQFEHLVSLSDAGFPNDIWFPSTEGIKPEESYQLDLFSNLKYKNHSFSLSSFYKYQTGILFYNSETSLPSLFSRDNQFWDLEVEVGNANAYGFEFDYDYRLSEKYFFHAAYTYNHTEYLFNDINEGNAFPFSYAVPHTFVMGTNIKLHKKWFLSLDWFSHQGRPISEFKFDRLFSPLSLFENNAERIGDFNALNLPNAYKLSLSLSTTWNWNSYSNHLLFGLQNVTNRRNVIYQYAIEEDEILVPQFQYGFPIMPNLLYRISF